MSLYRNEIHEAIVVVFDLRDEAAFAQAQRERSAWARKFCIIHTLDNNHIALEFLPGGGLEASA